MATYLITGTSRGLGRELATQLLQKGHVVMGLARASDATLSRTPGYSHHTVDLSQPDQVKAFLRGPGQQLNPDCLILNAAVVEEDLKGSRLELEVGERILQTNLTSIYQFITHFLPLFQTRGHGKFCAISSLSGIRGVAPHGVAYAASKAGLNMMFEALRLHCSSPSIQFITVGPGKMVETGGRAGVSICYTHAARRTLKAIESSAETKYFPVLMSWVFKISRMFPDRLLARALQRGFQRRLALTSSGQKIP